MAPLACPARPQANPNPKVCLRLQCAELGIDTGLLLPVATSERPPFPKLLQALATAGFLGRGYDASQSPQLADLDAALQRQLQLHREQQEFYWQVESHFSEMAETIQRMKRDYYREIDHLREQLSRSARDPRFKPDNVFFFDPEAHRLPSWQSIVDQLDGMRMKRELLKDELGGDRVRLVPVSMLCQACRRKFQSPEEAAKAYLEDHRDRCIQVGGGVDAESCTVAAMVQTDWMSLSEPISQAIAPGRGEEGVSTEPFWKGSRLRKLSGTDARNIAHAGFDTSCGIGVGSVCPSLEQEHGHGSSDKSGDVEMRCSSGRTSDNDSGSSDRLADQKDTAGKHGRPANNRLHPHTHDDNIEGHLRSDVGLSGKNTQGNTSTPHGGILGTGLSDDAVSALKTAHTGNHKGSQHVDGVVEDVSRLRKISQGQEEECHAGDQKILFRKEGCMEALPASSAARNDADEAEPVSDLEQKAETLARARRMAESLEKIFNRQPQQQGRRAIGSWRRKVRTRKEQAASLLARQLEALRKHQERFAFSQLKLVLVEPTLFNADFSRGSDPHHRKSTPVLSHRRQARPPGRQSAKPTRSFSEGGLRSQDAENARVISPSFERHKGAGTGLPVLRAGEPPREASPKLSSTNLSFANHVNQAPLPRQRRELLQPDMRSFSSTLPVCGSATLPQVLGEFGSQRTKGRHLKGHATVTGLERSALIRVS